MQTKTVWHLKVFLKTRNNKKYHLFLTLCNIILVFQQTKRSMKMKSTFQKLIINWCSKCLLFQIPLGIRSICSTLLLWGNLPFMKISLMVFLTGLIKVLLVHFNFSQLIERKIYNKSIRRNHNLIPKCNLPKSFPEILVVRIRNVISKKLKENF